MVEVDKDKSKKDGLVLQAVMVSGIVLISCFGGFLAIDKMSGPSCGGESETIADVRAARALYEAMTSRLLMEKKGRVLVDESSVDPRPAANVKQKPILTIKVVISEESISISERTKSKERGEDYWRKLMEATFLKFLELLGISKRDITDVDVTRVTFEPDDKVEIVCQIYLELNTVVFGRLKWFGIPFSDEKAFILFFKKIAKDLFHDPIGLEMTAIAVKYEESIWKDIDLTEIREIKPPEDINNAIHVKPNYF